MHNIIKKLLGTAQVPAKGCRPLHSRFNGTAVPYQPVGVLLCTDTIADVFRCCKFSGCMPLLVEFAPALLYSL